MIKRNNEVNAADYPIHRSEQVLLDIRLDKEGGIEKIELIKKDSSILAPRLNAGIEILKKKWVPLRCSGYDRIIVPVYIYFEGTEISGEQPFDILTSKSYRVFVAKRILVSPIMPRSKN